jgi:uncharacterized protein (DUF885 family)
MQNTETITPMSEVFKHSDAFVEASIKASPELATSLGYHDSDHLLDGESQADRDADLTFYQENLKTLKALTPQNEFESLALEVLREDLRYSAEEMLGDYDLLSYGVINSPLSALRELFDYMNYDTAKDISAFASRLSLISPNLYQWLELVLSKIEKGVVNTRYNTLQVIRELESAYESKLFQELVTNNYPEETDSTFIKKEELIAIASNLELELKNIAKIIAEKYLPFTPERLGVGREKYQWYADYYTYQGIDLDELYQYGLTELENLLTRMDEVAKKILPGANSLKEVVEHLNTSPKYLIKGEEELLKKLKDFTQNAIAELNGKEFDIPQEILQCEVKLNTDALDGAPYYSGPSEDLTRPGTTWFPTLGKDTFTFWDNASTWYHEGVPGHHLQVGTQILQKDKLSRYQRSLAWHSGYGEGWALYSERLMDELGKFSDPAYELGYLANQALRAARIVIDLGFHAGFKQKDGTPWSIEEAKKVLVEQALMTPEYAQSEVDRYLAWPGQAISYKVGERVWVELREEYKAQSQSTFDPKAFHAYALRLGSLRLDTFKNVMKKWINNQ